MKNLATNAVKITNIIKGNLTASPQEVIRMVLEQTDLTTDEIIELIATLGNELGVYKDVYSVIAGVQSDAINSPSDIHWNTLWSTIAQGLYYIAIVAANFVPKPWGEVIRDVLAAYEEMKGEKK